MKKQRKRTTSARGAVSGRLLSQAAYARHKGVSKQRVGQWVKEGRIVLTDGKVDARLADELLAASETPAAALRSGKANGSAGMEAYRVQMTRRASAGAALLELEHQKRSGELVSVEGVKQEWCRLVSAARNRLLSIPRIAAPQLAGQPTAQCEVINRRFICEALADLSGTEYHEGAAVANAPMVGAPESVTYNASGERIHLTLGKELDGSRHWLTSERNSWVFVRDFYDEKGNRVEAPDPQRDVGWLEFTNLLGDQCRRWVGPQHRDHPVEIFSDGEWQDIRQKKDKKAQ